MDHSSRCKLVPREVLAIRIESHTFYHVANASNVCVVAHPSCRDPSYWPVAEVDGILLRPSASVEAFPPSNIACEVVEELCLMLLHGLQEVSRS